MSQIADRFGMEPNDVLSNINVARAYSTDHQMSLLKEAGKLMTEQRYALIVVDSATALFRTEFVGRGNSQTKFFFFYCFFYNIIFYYNTFFLFWLFLFCCAKTNLKKKEKFKKSIKILRFSKNKKKTEKRIKKKTGELATRQQMLGKFLKQLLMLCDIFGVAVVITNQVKTQFIFFSCFFFFLFFLFFKF